MNSPALRDFSLLVARLVLGVVFIARGYEHWVGMGMRSTVDNLAEAGVPQPRVAAYMAGSIELLGGAMLIVGLLTTIAAGLMAIMVLVAGYFMHLDSGFFAEHGGLEYPLVLAVLLGLVVVFGAGRMSLDRVLAND